MKSKIDASLERWVAQPLYGKSSELAVDLTPELEALEKLLVENNLPQAYLRDYIRLFCFYIAYFYTTPQIKKLIKNYAPSGEVSNNRRDIKKAEVPLPDVLNTCPFDFIFPSPLVVNTEPDTTAVAEELAKRLRLLPTYGAEVKGDEVDLDEQLTIEL
jgi:hypothetical protein